VLKQTPGLEAYLCAGVGTNPNAARVLFKVRAGTLATEDRLARESNLESG